MKGMIYEHGSGFPCAGELVYHPETDSLYLIGRVGPVNVTPPDENNWVEVEISLSNADPKTMDDLDWQCLTDCCLELDVDPF